MADATVGAVAAQRVGARSRKEFYRNLEGWLWISPWIIGVLIFTLGPMLISLYWSFTSYDIVQAPRWIGIRNYTDMLKDEWVRKALFNTFYYAGVSIPVGLVLGLLLAILVNQNVRGISFWRTVYYLPAITATAAYAQLWKFLLISDYGLVNNVLGLIGITGPNWGAPKWIMPAFIMMSIWTVGGSMIINLAGLQSIPTELYDAAKVDGAAGWRLLRHITLPMMSPVIFYNLVMGIIGALQAFTIFFIFTFTFDYVNIGLGETGMVYMIYLYRNAFFQFRMGYGAALAWVLFVIILVLTLLVFKSSSSWVHYSGESRA
ncbi:MAG: sugar ABC transporter permease [Anaerolineae bacterium]|nr:sugar ABC transporter permease [Anaerolineae bacterium]